MTVAGLLHLQAQHKQQGKRRERAGGPAIRAIHWEAGSHSWNINV
jgi:hypothetical protein